ncbi:SET domain-containing protein [Trametopsis cervina]|nr:SET domain-containing protein [Trametopsis cervina]
MKPSLSPSPEDTPRTSTTPPAATKPRVKPAKSEPQLIGDLPRAEEAAMRTFVEIPSNHYQYSTLGRSREGGESMTCDCQYEHGIDDPDDACGHDSDCINRLTQVECLPEDCKCRAYCQNQRFQRKQHAPIEIVQTEKKGFGLRAADDLRKDAFIYEYVGDVVSHPSFVKRMRQYAEEGIRHFYFMMLQKDEYIDATKRGGIGRFANHSCNPNCYVAKWTVGEHVRMGIFANRNIKKDEELTFNYNVDRYGHEAQPCYCGEAKCVGFIGGKTQTDLAAMDDLYLDALGITDEVEALGLKGNKKKKGKKLDEDFVPELKPLQIKDVPKLVQAMRQTQSRKVLLKLLTRIKLTEDLPALRQIMRLRAFSAMKNILEDYIKDAEICSVALECMLAWPLIQRNKVDDSGIEGPIGVCVESDNEVVASLAKNLLEQWSTLESAYRIPKRLKGDSDKQTSNIQIADRPAKRRRSLSPQIALKLAPIIRRKTPPMELWGTLPMIEDPSVIRQREEEKRRNQVANILAKAAADAEAAAIARPAPPSPPKEESSTKKSSKPKLSKEEKEAAKEKQLQKLVSPIVVKCLSKYKDRMDHETFKKHAKELTAIISEKEKKSSSYKEGRLDSLSDEKKAKMKKYAKEYVAKIVRKIEKSKRKPSSSSSHREREASSSTKDSPHVEGSAHIEENHLDADDDEADSDAESLQEEQRASLEERRLSHPLPPKPDFVSDPRRRRHREGSGWEEGYERARGLPAPPDLSIVS